MSFDVTADVLIVGSGAAAMSTAAIGDRAKTSKVRRSVKSWELQNP